MVISLSARYKRVLAWYSRDACHSLFSILMICVTIFIIVWTHLNHWKALAFLLYSSSAAVHQNHRQHSLKMTFRAFTGSEPYIPLTRTLGIQVQERWGDVYFLKCHKNGSKQMASGYKKHLTEGHETDHVLNLMHYSKSKLQGQIQVTSKHVLIGRKLSNHIYYLKLLTGLYLRSTGHFCQYDTYWVLFG